MTVNLDSGSFKIVSLTEGNPPIGIDPTKLILQKVYINGPMQECVFHKGEHNKYRLSIGGYRYTGALDDKVVASTLPEVDAEWEITYSKYQAAYVIALAHDPQRGWTILPDTQQVVIKPIISTFSNPPQFLPIQLFRLEPVEN